LSFRLKLESGSLALNGVSYLKFPKTGSARLDLHFFLFIHKFFILQVPDIIDNAYVIVEFDNGSRGMLDLCMFAEGSKNEQEISVVGDIGKVKLSLPLSDHLQSVH